MKTRQKGISALLHDRFQSRWLADGAKRWCSASREDRSGIKQAMPRGGGILLYFDTCTSPYIAFLVVIVAKFCEASTITHKVMVRRIFTIWIEQKALFSSTSNLKIIQRSSKFLILTSLVRLAESPRQECLSSTRDAWLLGNVARRT